MPSARRSSSRRVAFFALGVTLALVPLFSLWGFTVDDALIPARYARHVARGVGYRFNADGPVTDGVTPLGWVYLLAPFAAGGALRALTAAKVLGAVVWTSGAGALAVAVDEASDRPARWAALALVPASAPLAAWSVAGLETGVVAGACAWATVLSSAGRSRCAAALCALVAAWRPETAPLALVLALLPELGARSEAGPATVLLSRPALVRGASVAAAVASVALIRVLAFGRPAPLSVYAKAPDPTLGARYALACFLLTGPIALLAPVVWARLDLFARGLVAAVGVHFVSIAVAGGDWMPLSRLAVPALPLTILAAAHVASRASLPASALRLALALAGELFAMVRVGPSAARVGSDRAHVRDELASLLAPARVVASLDIGWVGAVTEATVVDLGGVTDPGVAALPGGHTTRQIPASLLDARGVDTLVLLLGRDAPLPERWYEASFDRGVERRVAILARDEFDLAGASTGALRYLVLRRARTETAALGDPRP